MIRLNYEKESEMRDKIIGVIRAKTSGGYEGEPHFIDDSADQILVLIREEIEEVENPYIITRRWDDPRYMDRLAHECFEEGRQAILKALGENGS